MHAIVRKIFVFLFNFIQ